jgi:cell division protein FtsX
LDKDQLNAEKTTYFLRLVVTIVMVVGLIISLLSFYILMLSVYLLVQKNSSKLESLLLIGYSPRRVALPYQLLTLGLNAVVLVIAIVALWLVRDYYMDIIFALFPQIEEGTMLPALCVGGILFALVTVVNYIAIQRKISGIYFRK